MKEKQRMIKPEPPPPPEGGTALHSPRFLKIKIER